jgi:hypothetical protein
VRFDADIAAWRLTRPGAPDPRGPAIQRLPDGQWHFRNVGLRGGGNLPGRHAYETLPEAVRDAAPRLEVVPDHWWPDHVYAYLPGQITEHGTGVASVTLQQLRVSRNFTTGIPVTTLPPETPLSALPTIAVPWLRDTTGAIPEATVGSASGHWIRINLSKLSLRNSSAKVSKTPANRPYRLYQVGDQAYVLRPTERGARQPDAATVKSVRFFGDEFESMP